MMIRAAIIGMGVWGQNLVTNVQGLSQSIQFIAGATRTPAKATEFAGKRVLVSGGTKGLGRATVDRFLAGGARVITAARAAPETSTGAEFVQADLMTLEGCEALAQAAMAVLAWTWSHASITASTGRASKPVPTMPRLNSRKANSSSVRLGRRLS